MSEENINLIFSRIFIAMMKSAAISIIIIVSLSGCEERDRHNEYSISNLKDSIATMMSKDSSLQFILEQSYETQLLFDSLNHAKSISDNKAELKLSLQLANILRQSGLYYSSIRFYKEAYAQFSSYTPSEKAELLHGLSAIYFELYVHNSVKQQFLDSASFLADSAWFYARNSDLKQLQADVLNLKGALEIQKGNFMQALSYLEHSLLQHQQIGNDSAMAILVNLATAYHKTGNHFKALKFIQKAHKIAVIQNNSVFEYSALDIAAGIYMALGDTAEASRINNELMLIKSRRDIVIKSLLTKHALEEYETAENQKMIFGLLQEKVYFVLLSRVLTVGTIILLGVAIFTILLLRTNRKIEALRSENDKIQKQATMLELKNAQLIIAAKEAESLRLKEELELKQHAFSAKLVTITQIEEFLSKLRGDITSAKRNKGSAEVLHYLDEIELEINKNIQPFIRKELEEIYVAGNNKLVTKLNHLHPDLTINEKRLCYLISQNFSTKEIASILSKTYRSVEMARHRLRTKLKIDKDICLESYFGKLLS